MHIKKVTWVAVNEKKGADVNQFKIHLKKYGQPSGELKNQKAQLIAGGLIQHPGLDYKDDFTPAAKFNLIPSALSMDTEENPVLNWCFNCIPQWRHKEIYMLKPKYIVTFLY